MTSNQPPEHDRGCNSNDGDTNRREVAGIILFESRERRNGQEYRLEQHKKLSVQILGWTLVFWSIFSSRGELPTSSSWFAVAAVTGLLALFAMAYVIMPKPWTEAPRSRDMIRDYYDAGRPRSDLERSLLANLEESFCKNEARLHTLLLALRTEAVAAFVSVASLATAVSV